MQKHCNNRWNKRMKIAINRDGAFLFNTECEMIL